MSTVIVPVGLSMGQDFAAGDPGARTSAYWQVHLAGARVQLSRDETIAWGAAFMDPQRHADNEVDRTALEERLRKMEQGLADPGPVVSQLVQRGLLIELDPASQRLRDPFARLQLFPLAQGMGNTPENPDRYEIGFAGNSLVEVGPNVYAIWSYAMTEHSLWDACASLATGLDEDLEPGEQPYDLTAEEVARDVAAALPVLVTGACAFLDPVGPSS